MALTPWIRIGQPLEAVMSDYERIFDSWEQGGIRGLVFGRLLFADEQGQCTIPAFKSDLAPYQKRGLKAKLRNVPLQPDKEKHLHAMLADAKKRGWTLMIFAPASGTIAAEGLPLAEDPYGTQLHAAAWEDIFAASRKPTAALSMAGLSRPTSYHTTTATQSSARSVTAGAKKQRLGATTPRAWIGVASICTSASRASHPPKWTTMAPTECSRS